MEFPMLLCAVIFTINIVLINGVEIPKMTPHCDEIDGIPVRGAFLENKVLAQGLNRPYQLSYHRKKHEIFFSNNEGNDTEDKFEIRRLYHNGTDATVEQVENGFATAIDEENQIAFFGGSSGVYKMNLEDGKITRILEKYDIWDMFFKKHLYFIEYPEQKLFKYTHNKRNTSKEKKNKEKNVEHEALQEHWIHEKIYQFVIDGDDDVFITNETGLFMIKNGTEHRIRIHGETVFRAIEINHKGEAFFAGKNGIYVVRKPEYKLDEIAHVKNIFGLTFDNDGMIIYSNPLKIIKLLPSECKMAEEVAEKVAIPDVVIPN
ncbi:hypothetical protein O0L34_g8123 [Tuta absoluta]|nr:hypothetical protein O0L34_g8123 [Tuta absoluta]